jgi:hypothetical protein
VLVFTIATGVFVLARKKCDLTSAHSWY